MYNFVHSYFPFFVHSYSIIYIDIAKETTKEDELFDYAYVPDYHKTTDKSDEFEINL